VDTEGLLAREASSLVRSIIIIIIIMGMIQEAAEGIQEAAEGGRAVDLRPGGRCRITIVVGAVVE
jgi:hypothetical protein